MGNQEIFKKIPNEQAADKKIIGQLLNIVKETQDPDQQMSQDAESQEKQSSDQLKDFENSLLEVVAKTSEAQSHQIAQALSEAISNTDDLRQVDVFCNGLIAASKQLKPDEAAQVLFKALKNPLTNRDKLAQAIRDRFSHNTTVPGEDQGYWHLIEWGAKQKLIFS